MPAFKAAYLIHGDDHGRIAERRSRLRALAEAESGSAGVEVFEGDTCTPEAVAGALSAMTFAMGRRFVIADGVERWKDSEVEPVIAALKTIDADTLTVTFFAREEGRYKTPAALVKAIGKPAASSPRRWPSSRASSRAGSPTARRNSACSSTTRPPGRWSPASASASSACCARSRRSRSSSARARAVGRGDRRAVRRLVGAQDLGAGRRSRRRRPRRRHAHAGRAARPGRARDRPDVRHRSPHARRARRSQSPSRRGRAPRRSRAGCGCRRLRPIGLISDVRRRDVETFRRALELLADLEAETRGGGGPAQRGHRGACGSSWRPGPRVQTRPGRRPR